MPVCVFSSRRAWVRRWVAAAMVAGWVGASGAAAPHADYPQRPVQLVVPFAPGGSSDIVARLVAEAMRPALGQTVVVENKAGAGGMIGAELVAKATPDGYTVGLGSISTLAVNPVVLHAARVQPLQDFAFVVPLASIASVFAVHPSVPVHSFAEFVAQGRQRPDAWAIGSSGVGSIGHVILEGLNAELGLQMRHIPYKGMGPVVNSALAGETQVLSDQYPSSGPHVQAGRLRAFAVAAEQRLPGLPQVPTLAELGYPQLNQLAITWFGLVVPAGTPTAVVAKLNHAANAALQQPALRARLAEMGVQPLGGTPQALEHMVRETTAQVQQLTRQRHITDAP